MIRVLMVAMLASTACDFELVPEPDRDLRLAAEARQAEAARLATLPTFDNSAACRGFIEHFNSLPCVGEGVRLDAGAQCTEVIDGVRCDQTAFWACTQAGTQCSDHGLVQPGAGECPAPCG